MAGRQDFIKNFLGKNKPQKRKLDDQTLIVGSKKKRLEDLTESELYDYCFAGVDDKLNVKESRLLITITTNKTIDGISDNEMEREAFKDELLYIVKSFVTEQDNWSAKIKLEDYGNVDVRFTNPRAITTVRDTVNKITVNEWAWEEGPKFKRVHLHMMVTLEYGNFNGYFHVDRMELWNEIRLRMNHVEWYGRTPYINIRFIKNFVTPVERYIRKLHNQSTYETLAKRTLDNINDYKTQNNPNPEL